MRFSRVVGRSSPDPVLFFFLRIRRPPKSTLDRSSAASDVYKRQVTLVDQAALDEVLEVGQLDAGVAEGRAAVLVQELSLIHISEPTRPY